MTLPVLTAVTDSRWEAELVQAFEAGEHGVRVVRRCVDLADLLATAMAGTARAVVLSSDLRRLDRDVLARLAVAGVAVVGVAHDGDAEPHLRRLGVLHILAANAPASDVAAAVIEAVMSIGAAPDAASAAVPDGVEDLPAGPPGRIVAVWGPVGSPGRTTVAISLASEIACLGTPALLVDADVYGGTVAQALGLLDEAPGLAAAARLANSGLLDRTGLAELARHVGPNLRVLTGIGRAPRWPELRAAAVTDVLALCRSLAAVIVVDCAFCLEEDEELSYDQPAVQRNGATLAALGAADDVVAVGSADPVSLQRLVRGLSDLAAAVPAVRPHVVVNRVRDGVIPGDPRRETTAALGRYAAVTPAAFLPYDIAATDAALMHGQTLAEAAPTSPLRLAIRAYAAEVAGVTAHESRRRGWGLRSRD